MYVDSYLVTFFWTRVLLLKFVLWLPFWWSYVAVLLPMDKGLGKLIANDSWTKMTSFYKNITFRFQQWNISS